MQNGTQPACTIQLGTAGVAATASQTAASGSFEIIGTEASSQPLPAVYQGREITVTVAFTQPSSRDSSAAEDDGIVPYFPDPSAAEDAVTTRLSKKRGGDDSGPDGKWRAKARATDFDSSASIEKNCPPWRGPIRYGQEPFPLKLLIDPNTGYSHGNKFKCYHIVSDWRRQSPKYQADWWRDDAKFEKAIFAEEKRMEAEEKKAARKAKTAAKRNKNKRDKRKAAKVQAAAAAAAITEAEGDTEESADFEEVSCVFVLFVMQQYYSRVLLFLIE